MQVRDWGHVSPATVMGYNIYRGTKSGGLYIRVNQSLDSGTGYVDNSVQAGTGYSYVSTAVNANGVESKYSNQQEAVNPSP